MTACNPIGLGRCAIYASGVRALWILGLSSGLGVNWKKVPCCMSVAQRMYCGTLISRNSDTVRPHTGDE